MSGAHSNEAAELKATVAALAFEANELLTRITSTLQRGEDLAAKIQSLTTHNLDLASASGMLVNSIPDDLQVVLRKYTLVIRILEDFANKL